VRRAGVDDAPEVARLLHDFNTEFDEPVPEVGLLARRVADFIERGEAIFLLVGDGPDGMAELRFRPSLMSGALDAYLEELYVAPARRGRGLGRERIGRHPPFAKQSLSRRRKRELPT